MNLRRWTLLGLLLPILVGCGASTVNLIQYHRNMDRWEDTPAQLEARYTETRGLYAEIMNATTTPGMAPYPTLESNLESMKRYAAKAQEELGNIQKAKDHFEAYAYARKTVNSKDEQGWAEFQNMSAEYAAYSSVMSSHVANFNRAYNNFYQGLQAHGIQKTSNQEMLAQVEGMIDEVMSESKRMELSLADKISGMAFGTIRGRPGSTWKRRNILTEMGKTLVSLPMLKNSMDLLDETAKRDLAGNREFWTGPGMTPRPEVVDEVMHTHEQFTEMQTRFAELEAEFEEVGKPRPETTKPPQK